MLIGAVMLVVGIGVTGAIAALHTSSPSRRDIVSTREYLSARYKLRQSLRADLPVTLAALDAFVARIGGKCPGVLRGAPAGRRLHDNNVSERGFLLLESYKGVEIELLRSQAPSRLDFVRTIDRLHWSEPRVSRLIHAVVDNEAAWLTGVIPNVCGDMKAWVASGYQRLPARPRRVPFGLPPVSEQVSSELAAFGYRTRYPERDILQLLKRYENRDELATSDHVERLEVDASMEELMLLKRAMAKVERVVGLPRAEHPGQRYAQPSHA